MKKFIPFLCIFIIVSSVFLFLAYARLGDKPSDVAINSALYWGESLDGEVKFPYSDGPGYYESWLNCTNFVSNAYGIPALYGIDAITFWYYVDKQHPGDWNAPRGSLVFFNQNELNYEKGHVALSTGDGNLVEAGYSMIMKSTISAEDIHGTYLGWAWPPSDWHGRSDVFIATAITWAIQIGKAALLTLASWGIFLIIKKLRLQKSKKVVAAKPTF